MKTRVLVVIGALLLGTLTARPAQATPIIGAQIFAAGGNVTATFLGGSAAFTNELYLFSASDLTTPLTGPIFNNQTTAPGTSVNLGSFAAGTELVFAIKVLNTGHTFFMGPASRNPDGILHAAVDFAPPSVSPFPPNVPIPPGLTLVGFEDIFGGGDFDYDDLGFAFTNVRAVPEPGTLLLMGGSALAVAIRARRRSRRA